MDLNSTHYLLLGLINLRGPSTPYDLERALGHVEHHFWAIPHTRHYEETARLARAGLLSSTQETTGRRRRIYSITERGRMVLARWLAGRGTPTMDIKDPAEIKLFLGELTSREAMHALALAQAASYEDRLDELDRVADRFAGRPDLSWRLAPLRLGREVYRVSIEFWSSLAAEILAEGRPRPPDPHPTSDPMPTTAFHDAQSEMSHARPGAR